jgi:hypothetical protein
LQKIPKRKNEERYRSAERGREKRKHQAPEGERIRVDEGGRGNEDE